ncbi:molybdopterin molybdotransferase MoeA [Desulfatitalea alkaliphila]|uniref:Molybdopterin molybdenumtransferase n=1 Tax=Desulfatitalea alkaliphila TaxID=2929485 RepID=A0AA41UIT4_9BACT|nr:gephyrin-like molybdotransferase Glp [Desulfatitalea alkaliphila]MCJ8499872.1 molybdopterin molybdotransferase MoeA [Desulfatitalea alkaliphila]
MEHFFEVTDIPSVMALRERFAPVATEMVDLEDALLRVLAEDFRAPGDIPGFDRSTMDGYAVRADGTYGAGEGSPAYLNVVGSVAMGQVPDHRVGPGEASRIATGGMLPEGADSVMMVEHVGVLDEGTIEVYRSVAPGQHVVARNEDAAAGQVLLSAGRRLRPQEIGLLAACGVGSVRVHAMPRVGIISSGDEVVPVDREPLPGQVRDVNSLTLAGMVRQAGGRPQRYGIVPDQYDRLLDTCRRALAETDMVLVSGGSSVGTRDLTVQVLAALPRSAILVHGVSISPGKPTILAQCGEKAFWGLPGHVTSAMVVFTVLVRPFLARIGGCRSDDDVRVRARLTRNVASAQGRVDFVRVRLVRRDDTLWAEPVLGASGLIRTMVAADGLVAVDLNDEGLEKGAEVDVLMMLS